VKQYPLKQYPLNLRQKEASAMCREIIEGLYQIKAKKPGSHAYLIKGKDLTILVDSGVHQHMAELEESLASAGVAIGDIDILINTHEHFDHIGANKFFQDSVMVAAHRSAAVKIVTGDEEVTMCRAHAQHVTGYKVHMWLNNVDLIDAGDFKLKILHTPGHTSGCLCIYEPRKHVLISGDTVFAKGTIASVYKSGSLGEYLNSLRRLATMKIQLLLPGHGIISDNAEEDIAKAIENVETLMNERRNELPG